MSCLELISTIAALGSSVFAAVSAYLSRKSMIEQRKVNLVPVLSIFSAKALKEDHGKYPIDVYFTNTGKGTANFMVVDADRKDIQVNIGLPYSFGPDAKTNVRIFLNKKNTREYVNLALYYWDIDGNCYSTKVKLDLKYPDPYEEFPNDLFFVPRHRYDSCEEKNKNMPPEIIIWPLNGRDLFIKQDWDH